MNTKSSELAPLAVSPVRAAELIGIGRTGVFKLIASGELVSFKQGRRTLLPVAALRDWVARRTVEAQATRTERAA